MDITGVKVTNRELYNTVLNAYQNGSTAVRTDILEALIDAENVKAIMHHMVTVCEDKAQHVEENWQDRKLAGEWSKAAKRIAACANRLSFYPGIGYGVD